MIGIDWYWEAASGTEIAAEIATRARTSRRRRLQGRNPGRPRRARPVHRRTRRRPAGNQELEVGRPGVKPQALAETARALVAGDKGLLAIDESNPTCNTRFAAAGVPQTEEARRAYRELIVTRPGLAESISGLILYKETIRQRTTDGTPLVKVIIDAGILPGIKVDTGAKPLAVIPASVSPKVSTGCASAWPNT